MPKNLNKRPKDPNAPKKSQSSYFIFSNERRPILATENKGVAITEISKTISAEWKAMDELRKKSYCDRATELKKEYLIKLSEYQQSDNYKQFQKRLEEWKLNKKEIRSARKSKPPKKPKQPESMPKRPQSSYFVFSNQRRAQMKSEHPDKKLCDLSKLIAAEWKLKTSDDKKPYEAQAVINKADYTEKIETYKKTTEYSAYIEKVEEWKREKKRWENSTSDDEMGGVGGSGMPKVKISLPRKPKDASCPKRPLTSYFLYAKEIRESTKQEFPNSPITQIAKEISKKWNVLSEDEKKPYVNEAGRLKEAYKKTLADYEGSVEQIQYKKQLEEWKLECDRRKQAAKAKAKQAARSPKSSPRKVKKRKDKRKDRQMNVDSDSSSDSSSSGSYTSGSDSDSSGSSSSGSDSDSSSSSSD